mmetsp:Transcript_4582/g.6768  ORF Transcript_4582/g.6768 Transcript_4582/m.6768 type:complete len:167 (+) Transcript_4582:154-654(+)
MRIHTFQHMAVVVACICSSLTSTTAFAPVVPGRSCGLSNTHQAAVFGTLVARPNELITTNNNRLTSNALTSATTTSLYSSTDGRETGFYLMGFILALWIWLFSIPPEFRRARFCSAEDTAVYEQCWTVQTWTSGVADYYKGGGGFNLDFSIDPATLEENAEMFGTK